MTLSKPKYIDVSNIGGRSIHYKWDDWNVEQSEYPIDEEFCEVLEQLSERAILAFMCGTAEWIYYRFETLSDSKIPLDYLEAAWARLVDPHYGGNRWQEYSASWSGPIYGPIKRALNRLEETIEQLFYEDVDPYEDASLIANLAIYVMSDSERYKEWCEQVINRLTVLYPRDFPDQIGNVVPREVLDPDFNFKLDMTEDLVNKFISGLDYIDNSFLNSPEQMLEDGFEGIPYKFKINKDRG